MHKCMEWAILGLLFLGVVLMVLAVEVFLV